MAGAGGAGALGRNTTKLAAQTANAAASSQRQSSAPAKPSEAVIATTPAKNETPAPSMTSAQREPPSARPARQAATAISAFASSKMIIRNIGSISCNHNISIYYKEVGLRKEKPNCLPGILRRPE